ncbi:hypothetical protein AAF712_005979 [Marasmius tenuissimus]|uniref:Uncharacterized protein n=1 Tax=Marasmius tenuissimus TaxID=585030 RepID=A0ABR2ZZ67_9AGAR
MPKPIQSSIDSGDDDPYSEDDMLWHRGGSSLGGRGGSGTSFGGAKRVGSTSAFGNGNIGGPYGTTSVNNATGSEHANEHCDHYGNPPSYTTAATRSYDYDDRSRDASIVGSSSYASSSSSTVQMSLRARIFSFAASPTSLSFSQLVKGKGKARERERLISTKPGERGAGETETELDEPSRHLPTARLAAPKAPLIPPHILEQRITPLLFQCSRLLSVVPSFIGMLWCILCIIHYEPEEVTTRRRPDKVDYLVSLLWVRHLRPPPARPHHSPIVFTDSSDWIPMSGTHNGLDDEVEALLPAFIYIDTSSRATSDMLACNAVCDADVRCYHSTGSYMGNRRNDDLHVTFCTDLGDE